jgi:hypothetical protein
VTEAHSLEPKSKPSFNQAEHQAASPAFGYLFAVGSHRALFDLHRKYGNAAVQRLLSESGLDYHRLSTLPASQISRLLQRQEAVSPPTTGGGQDVTVNTIVLELGEHRWYMWGVDLVLPTPAAANGFIIQQVWSQVIDLETQSIIGTEAPYWEAWEVEAESTVPINHGADVYLDRFTLNPGGNPIAYGRTVKEGIVKFYPGPLPPEFGPYQPGQHFYMDFDSRPSGWDGTGTRRRIVAVWDERPGHPPVNRLQAFNGITHMLRDAPTIANP